MKAVALPFKNQLINERAQCATATGVGVPGDPVLSLSHLQLRGFMIVEVGKWVTANRAQFEI